MSGSGTCKGAIRCGRRRVTRGTGAIRADRAASVPAPAGPRPCGGPEGEAYDSAVKAAVGQSAPVRILWREVPLGHERQSVVALSVNACARGHGSAPSSISADPDTSMTCSGGTCGWTAWIAANFDAFARLSPIAQTTADNMRNSTIALQRLSPFRPRTTAQQLPGLSVGVRERWRILHGAAS